MRLQKLTLENFKGVRERTFDFTERTVVSGRNGSGKSSLLSAYLWLFVDKSGDLTANPAIRPIDAIDEVVPTVTALLDFDGKQVEIQKSQKLKRSKSGTVSLTNSYMINSVPKSERDFKEYMSGLGVDFDKFLQCTHPNVLLAGINNKKERDALRSMLFQMASDITDKQVAEGDDELFGISELLDNYTVQEIEAMQNATLRKIRENYGKEGEILRAKIEGLEAAKVEVDVAEINGAIAELNKRLTENQGNIDARNKKLEEIQKVSDALMDKKFRVNEIKANSVKDEIQKRSKMDQNIFMLEQQSIRLKDEIDRLNKDISQNREDCERYKAILAQNEGVLEKVKSKSFDESTAVCPTCGQKLPPDGVRRAKETFDKDKTERIEKIEANMNSGKSAIQKFADNVNDLTKKAKDKSGELKAMGNSLAEMRAIRNEMGNAPDPDLSENDEYRKLVKEIAIDEALIETGNSLRYELHELVLTADCIKNQITVFEKELAGVDQNKRIDNQIAEMRKQQLEYEQSKANAEMILDQIKTLNMKKNQMLQDSVNKHFGLISWRLFVTLKNSETRDACIPMIGDKVFGESMNTGLETMAKIDAINSIQNYFGLDYPIFLDNAEHLDRWSLEKIQTTHQLIAMSVSDDENLVFE